MGNLKSMKPLVGFLFAVLYSTFSFAADRFWIGGTGNWSDQSHWSASSGGAMGASVPTSADNVFFDVNSFTGAGQAINIDVTASCLDMNWTGVLNSPTFNGTNQDMHIFGSLTLAAGMTMNNFHIYFDATSTGKTITTAGVTFSGGGYIWFSGVGGGWTLLDNFITTQYVMFTNGTLNTNNQALTCLNFMNNGTNNARGLNLGSSVVTVTGTTFQGSGTNLLVTPGTSSIVLTGTNASFNAEGNSFYDVLFTNVSGVGNLYGTNIHDVIFSGTGNVYPSAGMYCRSVEFQKPGYIQVGSVASFGKVKFLDNGTINENNSYDTLIFSAGKTYNIWQGKTQTVNNLIQMNGTCTQPVLVMSSSAGSSTSLNSTSGVVDVNYTQLQDVTAGGGAIFTANNSYDLGNNTGWTINAPTAQNFYWIGGSGNWSDVAHWSLSSGGAAGTCLPTRYDNVNFDANSFAPGSIVTINTNAECASMNWTGSTNTPVLNGTADLNIYGSLTFISGMTNSFSGRVYFKSTGTGNTITSAGKSFTNYIVFDGANGDWTLQDALSITGTSGYLQLFNGFLATNNNNLTCYTFQSNVNNSRGLSLGTSTVTVTGPATANPWYVTGSNIFIDAGTSLIKFTAAANTNMYGGAGNYYYEVLFQDATTYTGTIQDGAGFYNVTFNAFGSVYSTNAMFVNKVTFTKDATIYGTNNSFGNSVFLANALINENTIFDTLFFSAGKTYTIGAGKTQSVNVMQATGTCTAPISIASATDGTFASFSSSNNITASYVQLKDIHANGVFVANNSIDIGNNTGWTINAPVSQNLYWRGGTGNWNDPAHWSFTSGGAGGACVPTKYDNVFFNAGSFTGAPKQVTINVPAYCNSINFTGVPVGGHSIIGSSDLTIYGSLTLVSTISIASYTGKVYFKSTTTGNTITSVGKTFNNDVYFDGTGSWVLQDAFNNGTNYLYLVKGTFNTNSKTVNCGFFVSNNTNIRGISLGASTINISGSSNAIDEWSTVGANLTLNAGTSTIKLIGTTTNTIEFNGGTYNYYDITFQDALNQAYFRGNATATYHNVTFYGPFATYGNVLYGGTFNKLDFKQDSYAGYNYSVDSLFFAPGSLNRFNGGTTITINKYLMADGTGGNLTEIYAYDSAPYMINKPSCTVCCNYTDIQYCQAGGGASFFAANSTNGGNNSGWNFASCPTSTLTVGPVTGPAATCVNGTNYTYSVPVVSGADSYTWSVPAGATILSGQGTNSIYVSVGSTAGTVSVTVSACGDIASAIKNITVNPLPVIDNISVTPATCSNSDGSATATVSGGTPGYYYRWSSGDTLSTAPALAAGQYQLIVFDIYGCRATANTSIIASNGPGISVVGTTPTTCNGGADGTASISVSGGTTPYTTIWSNGSSNLTLTNLASGPYEVTVTDANNCTSVQSITISQPTAFTNTFTINPSACAGSTGSAQVNVTGGTGSYTYQWDAAAANQTTQTANNLAAGVYQVIVTDANMCSITFTATVPNTATTLASSITNVIAGDCGPNSAGSATLDATGGAGSYTYLWSNGATTASITGVMPGNYYCTVTDASLCSSSQSVSIPSSVGNITQAICMVTVDTATFTNQVIWEKLITNDIQSYKIYRESNVQNVYTAIATVPFNNISEYTDPVANPAVHAWRYKITAVDSCGVETPHSASHKTIHLAQNLGVGGEINLSWDQYEGFSYYSYYIWRHDPSTGWMPLDTLSTNYTTYTDFTPPSSASRYMIEVSPSTPCNTTMRLNGHDQSMGVIVKSRSNIKTNSLIGIKDQNNIQSLIKVYPNPASSIVNVEVLNTNKEVYTIELQNMLGQLVYTAKTNQNAHSIDITNVETGVYFVKVTTAKGTGVQKVIVE